MTSAMKGLNLNPTYEGLINVAVSDKLYNIKFPNRDSTFLRHGFVLSTRIIEHILKQIAKNTGANFHGLKK